MAVRILVGIWILGMAAGASSAQSLPGNAVNVSRATGNSSAPAGVAAPDGRLHVAWLDNPGSDDVAEQFVFFARSSGAGFEAPRRISEGVDEDLRERELRLAASASGLVVAAWWASGAGEDRGMLAAYVAVSRNGGDSFSSPLETSLRFRVASAAKEGFGNTTSLSLALGPADEIYLLATVPDYKDGFNVYFARSTDGETFSNPRRLSAYEFPIPRATSNALGVLADGTVYAAWTEGLGDFFEQTRTVRFSTSTDGGRTFSPPEAVRGAQGAVAAVIADEATTLLLTQIKRTASARPAIKLNRSTDGGRAFGGRVKIGRAAGHSHLHQASIARHAETVAIAWAENSPRPTPEDGLYLVVSRDGGRSFDAPRLVASGLYAEPPSVVVDDLGRVGLFASSPVVSLADREVVFVDAGP